MGRRNRGWELPALFCVAAGGETVCRRPFSSDILGYVSFPKSSVTPFLKLVPGSPVELSPARAISQEWSHRGDHLRGNCKIEHS